MDPLEQQLKHALQREDPPEGFGGRVLKRCIEKETAARAETAARSHWRDWLFPSGWRLALAGTLAVAILGVGIGYRQHQERVRGEQARAQLMLALQVTGSEINRVHHILINEGGAGSRNTYETQ